MLKRKLFAGTLVLFVLLFSFQIFIATEHKHVNFLTPLGEQSSPHATCVICRNISQIALYFKRVKLVKLSVIVIFNALIIHSFYSGIITFLGNTSSLVDAKVRLDA